jgi:hypothetical protein
VSVSHRNRIERVLLEKGALTAAQIIDVISSSFKQCPTMNQLTNLLFQDPRFVKVGTTRINRILGGGYETTLWAHIDDVNVNIEES